MATPPQPAKPAALPMTRERIERRRHMLPGTRKVAQLVGDLLVAADTHATLAHYDIGRELMTVQANAGARYGESGDIAVSQIAGYWDLGEKTAASYIAVARTFDRAFVEEWSQKVMPTGRTLTTGHWILLARLASAQARAGKLHVAFARSMTVEKLTEHLKKSARTPGTRVARRPSRRWSPVGEINAIDKLAVRLAKHRESVRNDLVPTLTRGGMTEVTRERATELLWVLTELRKFIDETEVGLTQVLRAAAPRGVTPTEDVGETHETETSVEDELSGDDDGAGEDIAPDEMTELPQDYE